MNAPWWFAIGGALFSGMVAFVWIRWFRQLWQRSREHPEEMGDEWDPWA